MFNVKLLFFFQLSSVSLSSQIMPHFVTKFVYETFEVRFVAVGPPAGVPPPGPHRGCAPDSRASLPRPAHHQLPAIIEVTQAANLNVLIG